MIQYSWTNISKVIKAEVNTLQAELEGLLKQKLLGLYLHGSLALGGFQPARSDINIIAVVTEKIDPSLKRALGEALLRISNRPRPIDIYFLAEGDLFPLQSPPTFDFHYNERLRLELQQEMRGGQWQQWNDTVHQAPDLPLSLVILQRVGIVLSGKPVQETLPAIPEEVFRQTLVQAFEEAQARLPQDLMNFVLNACRTLVYLQEATLLSKDAGGEWGLLHLPEQYKPLIQQSLALYRGESLQRPVGRAVLEHFTADIRNRIEALAGTNQ